MQIDDAAALRTDIRVQIAILSRTLFRAWAGRGRYKGRSLQLTDALLDDFIPRLHFPLALQAEDGSAPTREEFGAVVKDAFLSVDDATAATAAAGKTQDERDMARAVMAERIAVAIEARWTVGRNPVKLY